MQPGAVIMGEEPRVKKALAIFGSCVSADSFPSNDPDFRVVKLKSRSTIRSLLSEKAPPIAQLDDLAICQPKSASQYFVLSDLQKNIADEFAGLATDYFILDLTSEIIPTAMWRGSLVAFSDFFKNFIPEEHRQNMAPIKASAEEVVAETRQLIPKFCHLFADMYGAKRMILHEAFPTAHYYSESGVICAFDEPTQEAVVRLNQILGLYYQEIKACLPGIHAVRVDPALRYGDVKNKWGLAIFHYIPDYYQAFRQAVYEIAY